MPLLRARSREGLRAFPTVNSSVDGTNIVLHKECNGIASRSLGLDRPGNQNAEEKISGIARALNELAERAARKN